MLNVKKIPWIIRAMVYGVITKIGFPSYIGTPVFISRISNMRLGKRVRIYPGLRAELENKNSYLTIGDNVSIGQNFHVVSYNGNLVIGSNVTISGNVMVTNCDHSYDIIGKHILEQPLISNTTIIGENSFIGYGAVILAGTKLGKQTIVGANSVVRGIFPDYVVLAGVPAKIIKTFDSVNNSIKKGSTYGDKIEKE